MRVRVTVTVTVTVTVREHTDMPYTVHPGPSSLAQVRLWEDRNTDAGPILAG